MILLALLAAFAVGPPRTPPPHVSGVSVTPPPAWIDDGVRSKWLAYGGYCWQTQCVDFLPPAQRTLPVVAVQRGTRLTVHFRFSASDVTVRVGTRTVAAGSGSTIAWRARSGGILDVHARGPGGSASYLARIRIG